MAKKQSIEQWIQQVVNGGAGFKMQEDRECVAYSDREVGVASFVIRALANPKCEGSRAVLEAICEQRGDAGLTAIARA